jgi:hypothetical protein
MPDPKAKVLDKVEPIQNGNFKHIEQKQPRRSLNQEALDE